MSEEKVNNRIFELDVLRGISILLMILHHFIYDLRHVLGLDVFAFQDTDFFINFVRGVFLCVFVVVSGICCQFSRNNIKRAGKMAIASVILSLAMLVASLISKMDLYIFFNMLYVLTICVFLQGLFDKFYLKKIQKMTTQQQNVKKTHYNVFLLVIVVLGLGGELLPHIFENPNSIVFLPFGFIPENLPGMGDYLPLFPWIGFFFLGVVIGKNCYTQKKTRFPGIPDSVKKVMTPLVWSGQNALWVYLFHQPVLLGVLFLLRYVKII